MSVGSCRCRSRPNYRWRNQFGGLKSCNKGALNEARHRTLPSSREACEHVASTSPIQCSIG